MNILDWLKSIILNEWVILSKLLVCLFIIIKGTWSCNSQKGNLWFLVLKLKDLDELQPVWKFQWISMFNVWDNWDQIFYNIPKIYDILVLCPYQEIIKTLNSIFSRKWRWFDGQGWFFKSIFLILCQKCGYKKMNPKFLVYLTIFSLLCF